VFKLLTLNGRISQWRAIEKETRLISQKYRPTSSAQLAKASLPRNSSELGDWVDVEDGYHTEIAIDSEDEDEEDLELDAFGTNFKNSSGSRIGLTHEL